MSEALVDHDADRAARTLTLSRLFNASPNTLFEAWTDPQKVVQWWGPEGVKPKDTQSDVRPGGAWHILVDTPQGEKKVSGVYQEVERPSRLVYTWGWHNDGVRAVETIVTVEFRSQGDKTEIHLHQELFNTADNCADHNKGWNGCFDALSAYLSSQTK